MATGDRQQQVAWAIEQCEAAEARLLRNELTEEELRTTLARVDAVLERLDGLDWSLVFASRDGLEDSWNAEREKRWKVSPGVARAARIVRTALSMKGTDEERLAQAQEALGQVKRLAETTEDAQEEGSIRRELEPLVMRIDSLERRLRGEQT